MSLARLEASVSGGAETGPAGRRSAGSRAGQIVTPLHSLSPHSFIPGLALVTHLVF